MLRIHFMQQWFTLSDPGMEEAFFDTPLLREFAQLDEFARLPDESTILRFRHRLEKHKLAEQMALRRFVWNLQATIDSSRARWGLWGTRYSELSTNPRGVVYLMWGALN